MAEPIVPFKPVSPVRNILPDFQSACPLLGLEGDPATRGRLPTEVHRCFKTPDKPRKLSERQQTAFCLTGDYEQCPIYQGASASTPLDTPGQPPRPRLLPHDARPQPRTPRPRRRGEAGPIVAVIAAIVLVSLLGLGGVIVARNVLANANATKAAPSTAARSLTTAPANAGGVIALATDTTVLPTTEPTAIPSPTATSPTPVATARPTYAVVTGDSYNLIAQRFGISLDQLLKANNRTIDDQLFPGTVLQLP